MLERPVVALTGATGFLGPHIITALSAAGYHVKALTRRSHPETVDHVTWVNGDLADMSALEELADGVQAMVHAAGATKSLSAAGFFEVNEQGTRRVAEATAAACGRLILVSSLAAREPDLSPYAASKLAAEKAALAVIEEASLTVLRPPAIYGPGDFEFLRLFQAAKRGLFPLPPHPAARMSLVHAYDVAGAIVSVVQNPPKNCGPYDVHDGLHGGYDWEDIARLMEQVFQRPLKRLRTPAMVIRLAALWGSVKGRVTGKPEVVNLRKLPELFHHDWVCHGPQVPGFLPKITLEQGFKGTLGWYRSQNLLKSFD